MSRKKGIDDQNKHMKMKQMDILRQFHEKKTTLTNKCRNVHQWKKLNLIFIIFVTILCDSQIKVFTFQNYVNQREYTVHIHCIRLRHFSLIFIYRLPFYLNFSFSLTLVFFLMHNRSLSRRF